MSIDSKARKANYYAALKTLDSGPREIEQARAQYDTDMGHVREMEGKGYWAPVAIQKMKDAAQSKRDESIRKAVDRMKPALETVQAERTAPGDMLDIDKVQNVISVVNAMGKKLSPADQLAIIQKYRGDSASLNFISDLFAKNGLYYADYARQLTAPVPSQAIEEMAVEIGRYDAFGKFETDNIRWTRNEYKKALERCGVVESENPYITALRELKKNGETEMARQAAASALASMSADGEKSTTDDMLKQMLDTCLAVAEVDG